MQNRDDCKCKICGKPIPAGTFHWQPEIRISSQQKYLVNPGVGRALMHICMDCVIEREVILNGLSTFSICRCCESLIPDHTLRVDIGVIKAKYEGGSLCIQTGKSTHVLSEACAKGTDLLEELYKSILKYLSEEAKARIQPFNMIGLPQLKIDWK